MNCSRCGAAEAVLKRDAAFYCGKCALARDWEQVIALVQEDRVEVAAGGATIDFDAGNEPVVPLPAGVAATPPPAAAPAPDGQQPPRAPEPSNGELPADPFA